MYKVSVIIPMYNVEEFLKYAIESLKKQTIGFENLEILLIDDCSTDGTSKIANDFSNKYKNVIYYKMPQNSGMAGKPRNVGMTLATSKYIMFLDPDDLYLPNACKIMYDTIEAKNLNIVTANFKWVDINGNDLNRIQIDRNKYSSQYLSISKPEESLQILTNACWTKIVNREFILHNDIRFLEGVPAEDAYFTYNIFLKEKSIYYLDEVIVDYRVRDAGNVSETNNLTLRYFNRIIQANREIFLLFNKFSELVYYKYYYIDYFVYIVRKVILSNQTNLDEKVEALINMKDLLENFEKFGFSRDVENDEFNFLEIFEITNTEEMETFVEKFMKIFKDMGMDEVRRKEKLIITDLKKQI